MCERYVCNTWSRTYRWKHELKEDCHSSDWAALDQWWSVRTLHGLLSRLEQYGLLDGHGIPLNGREQSRWCSVKWEWLISISIIRHSLRSLQTHHQRIGYPAYSLMRISVGKLFLLFKDWSKASVLLLLAASSCDTLKKGAMCVQRVQAPQQN